MEHLYAATAACWAMFLLTWPLDRWFGSGNPYKANIATVAILGVGALTYVLTVILLDGIHRNPTI